MQSRAPWFLIVFIAACAAPMQLDAGLRTDAGVATAFCLASRCDVEGTWQVAFTLDSGTQPQAACALTQAPLRLTSDGGAVCLIAADDGSSDGGCRFRFHVSRNGFDWVGSEAWAVDETQAEGGVIVGTWTVDSTFPPCSAAYSIRAMR